jgi:hypothetical protein
MESWPFFKQINNRMVGAVWRNELYMKDVCCDGRTEPSCRGRYVQGGDRAVKIQEHTFTNIYIYIIIHKITKRGMF